MGVPGLLPWIQNNFPGCVYSFYQGKSGRRLRTEYLYIDGNAIIHPCASKVFNYGEDKIPISPYDNYSIDVKIKKVFDLLFQEITKIVSFFDPSDLKVVYLAIDGSAPSAKQAQQRQRRFLSDKGQEIDFTPVTEVFDNTQITPGTLFMLNLTKYCNMKIRELITNGAWKKFEVIFSDSSTPGEGEHKLLDYYRILGEEEKKLRHTILSPDADLVMLEFGTLAPNIYLLRPDQSKDRKTGALSRVGYYDFIDLSSIMFSRTNIQTLAEFLNRGKEYERQSVDDFILLGFFVGNDFLPMIQMFVRLRDGLDMMMRRLRKSGEFITTKRKINMNSFRRFIGSLAKEEVGFLEAQLDFEFSDEMFINKTLQSCASGGKLDYDLYRKKYYTKAFNGGITVKSPKKFDEEQVKEMSIAYLKMLAFVLQYYTVGLPSWEFLYPYNYAPLMKDLYKYSEELVDSNAAKGSSKEAWSPKFSKGQPAAPIQQLLSVLPVTSVRNIPEAFQRLMLSENSPLVEAGYYPRSYHIDYEGKTDAHRGIVILPFVDIPTVRKAYEKVIDELGYSPRRNRVGPAHIYRWRPKKKPRVYKSKYGRVQGSKVEVETLVLE